MDIVLELVDTFALDYLYATLLPAGPPPYDLLSNAAGNTTTVPRRSLSPWVYKPATVYFSIQPAEAAYMSVWPRDNLYRQALSLFLITWFVF
jgi:Delta7-sterol 5-desaturase